jgi:hypothetical protein
MMMKLRHATTRDRAESILREGLLVSCADEKAKIKAVWLHAPSLTPWAILHTQRKHKVQLSEVVVLEVSVPRGWLKKYANGYVKKGFWYCKRDVPSVRIERVIEGSEFGKGVSQ